MCDEAPDEPGSEAKKVRVNLPGANANAAVVFKCAVVEFHSDSPVDQTAVSKEPFNLLRLRGVASNSVGYCSAGDETS